MKHTLSPFDALPPLKPVDGQQQAGSRRSLMINNYSAIVALRASRKPVARW